MNSRRDPNLVIQSFLAEGIDELPDRSFDAVRTAIDQTRQWAVIGPWKEPQIMTATRFALIAAAIAVLAVVAIRFLPSTNIGPAPAPTPTVAPTLTPSPTPSPTRSPTPSFPITASGPEPIVAGTYSIGNPFLVPLSFAVPTSWMGNIGGAYAVFLAKSFGTNNVSFTLDQSLYADACHVTAGFASATPGPSTDDLAMAFTKIKGLTSTGPTDVTIGGYPGKQVTLTSPTDVSACDTEQGGLFRIWRLPLGGTEDIGPGWTDRLTVVDVGGGQRLVIQSSGPSNESDAAKADVNSIISSLAIKP
jgi:hypothetical protein